MKVLSNKLMLAAWLSTHATIRPPLTQPSRKGCGRVFLHLCFLNPVCGQGWLVIWWGVDCKSVLLMVVWMWNVVCPCAVFVWVTGTPALGMGSSIWALPLSPAGMDEQLWLRCVTLGLQHSWGSMNSLNLISKFIFMTNAQHRHSHSLCHF